jgi:hypothetical protein
MGHDPTRPLARASRLVVKEVADEVLVYDLERSRAHSLNPVAAAVWRRCDGTRTLADLAVAVRAAGTPITDETVQYALQELGRARLLAAPVATRAMTRREVMRRLGTAAAVALPLVTSVIAPTAAEAQSCLGEGAECSDSSQCCSNNCDDECFPPV